MGVGVDKPRGHVAAAGVQFGLTIGGQAGTNFGDNSSVDAHIGGPGLGPSAVDKIAAANDQVRHGPNDKQKN